jgi:aspartate kinase
MKVFKFGGASVKNAEAVRNVVRIIAEEQPGFVIISAMAKTTNGLEQVLQEARAGSDFGFSLAKLRRFHDEMQRELSVSKEVQKRISELFDTLENDLRQCEALPYDLLYDRVVAVGELASTLIVHALLRESVPHARWLDARKFIITDDHHRKANVDWVQCKYKLLELPKEGQMYVIQGFIGRSLGGQTTTLGREGSDYSAAIIAHIMDAASLTVWKDVPGILNADPRYFKETVKLDHISFREAVELSFHGASVLHPKTIKPIQNKNIPLFVRSFLQTHLPGTRIDNDVTDDRRIPCYIFKPNQVLISLSPRDFSFIGEKHLAGIFQSLYEHKLEATIMQNSAINFSFSVEVDEDRIPRFIAYLKPEFRVLFNKGLELLTVRHYDADKLMNLLTQKEVILEQKTRSTVKMLLRDLNQEN